jgi:hypothetical protein
MCIKSRSLLRRATRLSAPRVQAAPLCVLTHAHAVRQSAHGVWRGWRKRLDHAHSHLAGCRGTEGRLSLSGEAAAARPACHAAPRRLPAELGCPPQVTWPADLHVTTPSFENTPHNWLWRKHRKQAAGVRVRVRVCVRACVVLCAPPLLLLPLLLLPLCRRPRWVSAPHG